MGMYIWISTFLTKEVKICPVLSVSMTMLHAASWNKNGLNAPIKCSMCLDWLRRHRIDVAFIQESLLKHSDKHCMSNRYYYTSAAATFSSKSRRALVVLRRSLSLRIIGSYGSEDGRVAYIKTNIYGQKIAFLCIYATNHYCLSYLAQLARLYVTCRTFQLLLALT